MALWNGSFPAGFPETGDNPVQATFAGDMVLGGAALCADGAFVLRVMPYVLPDRFFRVRVSGEPGRSEDDLCAGPAAP